MNLRPSDLDRSAVLPSPTRLDALCESVIEAGWLAVLVAVPLYFNPYSSQTFDPDKTVALRVLVLLMAATWLVKVASGGRVAAPESAAYRDRGLEPGHGRGGELRWWRIPLLVPTAGIVLTALASAAASIQPSLSFAGSYTRAQGVWTQLSYVALFALVLAHLRTARQWRRIVYAVALTSFAVSSYAVLQRLGLDPVPWSRRDVRVGSTMGNPIFLAGFLLFVVFITVHELQSRWRSQQPLRTQQGARGRGADVPTLAILVYNLVLQALAIVFAQSRGPVLGLLAGGFVASLALLLVRRDREAASPRRTWLRRNAWLFLIVVAVGLLALLAAASRPGTRASRLARLPHVGRLLAPFNLDVGTARVRVLLWEGGVDLLRDLSRPGSGSDLARPPNNDSPESSVSSVTVPPSTAAGVERLLLGYGPEMFRLAYTRYLPSEIAAFDDPTAVPDRGHNEVLDRLATTGVLGFASWFWWYGALLLTALTGVVAPAAASGRLYWSLIVGGAIAGAVVPTLLGLPALAFFGVPTGVLAGVVVFLVLGARRATGEPAGPRTPYRTLSIALLATATAHLVEINLGIAVTATTAYLWFFAAVLVAVERRWLALDEPEPDAPRATATLSSAAVAGLLAALVASTLGFAFLGNWNDLSSAIAVLAAGFTGASGIATSALWLPVLCWMAAVALAGSLERRLPGGPTGARPPVGGGRVFGITSLVVGGAYLLYQSSRLAVSSRMRSEATTLPDLLDHISGHATAYTVFLLGWTLLAGAAVGIASRHGRSQAPTSKERWRMTAVVAVAAAALVPAVAAVVRRPTVDSLVKNAAPLASAGVEDAMAVLRRAVSLDSREPVFALQLGGALVEAARRTESDADRARWLGEARRALETARSLAPLDPDHTANLARLEAVEAGFAPDPATRRARLDAAAETFADAVALRPSWTRLLVEYAAVEYRRDRRKEAFDLIGRALKLHPSDPSTHRTLAGLHRADAAAARLAGDESGELDHQRLAEAATARAVRIEEQQRKRWVRRQKRWGALPAPAPQPNPSG